MRRKVKPGRYILLFGLVAAILYAFREQLKAPQKNPGTGDYRLTAVAQDSLDFPSLLENFPCVYARTDSIKGDTLFLANGGVVLLGTGDRRLSLALLDTLLALETNFDTIDLRIRGYAVIR